ncbi:hypothetical protein WICPIJ_010021 [Wickerhamomyces pijperi]|uniref:Uncharacterized protein n=1 Tax=Wickerhamomyces pijperi TaxID=599730 RepID=A0A9P8TBX9_WICPI|nr:hypothetical protein WICPIJ_010021 [Wickerhamomyces pijperi]
MAPPPANPQDVKRLLNTLYPYLSKNPVISKLHNTLLSKTPNPVSTTTTTTSSVNRAKSLFKTRPVPPLTEKLPLNSAISLLPSRSASESCINSLSNILYFRTKNQNLQYQDFASLTSPLTSQFQQSSVGKLPGHQLFHVLKARDPKTLSPRGGYYLVFTDVRDAAAFLIDTSGLQIYGSHLNLEMVSYAEHSGFITQPLLDETESTITDIDVEVLKIRNVQDRGTYVLIAGVPNFIKIDTLRDLLWDYQLDYSRKLQDGPLRCLVSDDSAKVSNWIVKFQGKADALRSKRNWNGKEFNGEDRLLKVSASVLD